MWELVATDFPIGGGEVQTHRMRLNTGWLYRTLCVRYNDDGNYSITGVSMTLVPEDHDPS